MAGATLNYSDATIAVELAFEGTDPQKVVMASRMGPMICDRGSEQSIDYVSEPDACGLVAVYRDGVAAGCGPPEGPGGYNSRPNSHYIQAAVIRGNLLH